MCWAAANGPEKDVGRGAQKILSGRTLALAARVAHETDQIFREVGSGRAGIDGRGLFWSEYPRFDGIAAGIFARQLRAVVGASVYADGFGADVFFPQRGFGRCFALAP